MVNSAEAVSRSVESMAAVSQENSAAAEDGVGGDSEDDHQVAKVVSSTTAPAEMASQLDAIAARLRLDDVAAPGTATTAETCSEPPRLRAVAA